MTDRPNSPAVQMVRLVCDDPYKSPSSWRRLNTAYQTALELAITAQLHFDLGDFRYIDDHFLGQYWMGLGTYQGENWHGMAVAVRNTSAILSCEKWLGRPPFFFDQIVNASGDGVTRRRLTTRDEFLWLMEDVLPHTLTVTSFARDGQSLTACLYDMPKHTSGRKPLRRVRITLAELKADMKTRKKEKADENRMESGAC